MPRVFTVKKSHAPENLEKYKEHYMKMKKNMELQIIQENKHHDVVNKITDICRDNRLEKTKKVNRI